MRDLDELLANVVRFSDHWFPTGESYEDRVYRSEAWVASLTVTELMLLLAWIRRPIAPRWYTGLTHKLQNQVAEISGTAAKKHSSSYSGTARLLEGFASALKDDHSRLAALNGLANWLHPSIAGTLAEIAEEADLEDASVMCDMLAQIATSEAVSSLEAMRAAAEKGSPIIALVNGALYEISMQH